MWQKTFPFASANIGYEVNIDNAPPKLRMRQWRQIYEVKTIPQTTGSIEDDLQYVHMRSASKRVLVVYN